MEKIPVVAPTFEMYEQFRRQQLETWSEVEAEQYRWVNREEQVRGYFTGPIVVINGGSHDPHIRRLLAHPLYKNRLTYRSI